VFNFSTLYTVFFFYTLLRNYLFYYLLQASKLIWHHSWFGLFQINKFKTKSYEKNDLPSTWCDPVAGGLLYHLQQGYITKAASEG